ncbi:biopolymer transport protein ExbD [Cellulophaga sp. RHA19]|uniref:ExbD/TolR family protein n=1 Tax=Cellulophaga sp. RHA19 TaxID=1798237 RepID=UPI000C2BFAA5|nr:biopolymer transporter ExbD [Cellulophaga sp. RHA19]PKB42154.1 biopolymer transport protein ExbD [Cellulophaga sp. RHA19]
MARRGGAPEVNAGSMADIAFLLLIFFLVTTTIETDAGLDRMLPPKEPPTDEQIVLKQKNIFTVQIGKDGQLLVEEDLMDLKDLKDAAIAFLDNGGAVKGDPDYCDYCEGARSTESSDNPFKAVISLKNDRETKYSVYITVQNELVAAYNALRNRAAKKLGYNMSFTEMEAAYSNQETPDETKEKLKVRIKKIQDLYPQKLSEAETTTN